MGINVQVNSGGCLGLKEGVVHSWFLLILLRGHSMIGWVICHLRLCRRCYVVLLQLLCGELGSPVPHPAAACDGHTGSEKDGGGCTSQGDQAAGRGPGEGLGDARQGCLHAMVDPLQARSTPLSEVRPVFGFKVCGAGAME